jgi:hypothetical protein
VILFTDGLGRQRYAGGDLDISSFSRAVTSARFGRGIRLGSTALGVGTSRSSCRWLAGRLIITLLSHPVAGDKDKGVRHQSFSAARRLGACFGERSRIVTSDRDPNACDKTLRLLTPARPRPTFRRSLGSSRFRRQSMRPRAISSKRACTAGVYYGPQPLARANVGGGD